jgi:SAM domain (Sterile alpha motif)
MKYSKTGILKKKIGPASDILQEEAKRMEERLSELKEFMQKEKEKRDSGPKMKDGSKWRSAVTTKPISGYADLVLSQKPKIQTKPKPAPKKEEFLPTSAILGTEEKPAIPVPKDEVLDFLANCGMEKYHKVFLDNGIEEIEILLELTEAHLTNMNIPLGHRLKILKKIKDVKGKENNYKQLEPAYIQPKSHTNEICVGDDHEIPAGEFDEKSSQNMFQEALELFRNSGSPTKHKNKSKSIEEPSKKVRFLEPVTEEMLPKEIKGMLYEGAWEPEQSALPETFEESSGTANSILINDRKACWNCYKIFSAEVLYQAYDKEFCSDRCGNIYFNNAAATCPCGKKFIKNEGLIVSGIWVCNEQCGDQVPEPEPKKLSEESEPSEEFYGFDPVTGDPIARPEDFS